MFLRPFGLYFSACFLFLDPQDEFGPSISSSVVLFSSVLLVYIVAPVSCSLILKMKLVPPSFPRSSYVPPSFWFILYPCLVFYLCPSSVRVVATFPGNSIFKIELNFNLYYLYRLYFRPSPFCKVFC